MNNRKTIRLYHGTRANPELIWKHGLIPHGFDGNKDATCDRVLAEFGFTREDVPAWIYRGELLYERERGQDHTHFGVNKLTAIGYSQMGGEPAYVIRHNLLLWLNRRRLSALRAWDEKKKRGNPPYYRAEHDKLARELNRQAEKANGHKRYLVTADIDVDDPALEKDVFKVIERLKDIERTRERDCLTRFFMVDPYEVRYYGIVPPEQIVSIEEVTDEDYQREYQQFKDWEANK